MTQTPPPSDADPAGSAQAGAEDRRRRVRVVRGGPAERVDPQQLARPAIRRPAGVPAEPVAISSALRPSVASAPALSRAPARDAREHRLRLLARCQAQHPVVVGAWWRRRRPAGLPRSRGRAPARSARRPRSRRRAPSSPAPAPSRAAPAAPGRSSAQRRARFASPAAPRPPRPGPRQVATTCGSGSSQPVGSGMADGSVSCSCSGGCARGASGSGHERRATQLARVLDLLPPVARAVVGEGGAAGQRKDEQRPRQRASHPSDHQVHARAGRVSAP